MSACSKGSSARDDKWSLAENPDVSCPERESTLFASNLLIQEGHPQFDGQIIQLMIQLARFPNMQICNDHLGGEGGDGTPAGGGEGGLGSWQEGGGKVRGGRAGGWGGWREYLSD